jgi:hypothetical protein
MANWWVLYSGIIANGSHSLTLTASDSIGNTVTKIVYLNVVTKPTITEFKPVTYNPDLKPTVSAKIKEVNTAINPASIVMTLNNTPVTHSYNATTGVVSYIPARNLENEKYYTVNLTVDDMGGLTSAKTWKFYTNNYPDMADSNISNCTTCHATGTNPLPFEAVHKNLTYGGSIHSEQTDCGLCHIGSGIKVTSPGFDICGQCHGSPGDWYHGQHADIKYIPGNPDPTFPVRITQNREMADCIVCHQPGTQLKKKVTGVQVNNHDIPELHKAPPTDCNKCHALSLTREHARSGRLDKNGQAITCNTCHKSADSKVTAAIAAKNKHCNACHTQSGHDELHISGLDAKCQSCHKDALTQEHLNNSTTQTDPVTKLVNDFNCNTCHNNTGKEVKRTIAANKLNCTSCHSKGHNIKFSDNVPIDIPLYAGYKWTLPIEASILTGESTSPAGYDEGQVIISDRRTDATVSAVWIFYNQGLTATGWTLKSGAPADGAASFNAVFEKEGRAVTVKYYNTVLSDGTGGVVGIGYRLEIWYK